MGLLAGKNGYWSQKRPRKRQLAVVRKQNCNDSGTHCLEDIGFPPMNKEFIWLHFLWFSESQQAWRNESPHATMATCFLLSMVHSPDLAGSRHSKSIC